MWYKFAQSTVYIRFGKLPTDKDGNYVNSTNWLTMESEPGISVYTAHYDRITKKFILNSGGDAYLTGQDSFAAKNIDAYLVTGRVIDAGSDGEDLLDPSTVKVLRKLRYDEIVDAQDHWRLLDGNELDEKDTPQLRPRVKDNTQIVMQKRREYYNLVKDMSLKVPDLTIDIYSVVDNLYPSRKTIVAVMDSDHMDKKRQLYYLLKEPQYSNIRLVDIEYFRKDPDEIYLYTVNSGKVTFKNYVV